MKLTGGEVGLQMQCLFFGEELNIVDKNCHNTMLSKF